MPVDLLSNLRSLLTLLLLMPQQKEKTLPVSTAVDCKDAAHYVKTQGESTNYLRN